MDVRGSEALANIAADVRTCRRCATLNLPATQDTEATTASPGAGDPESPVVIVGQSLCGKPCIDAQVPFTGGSGHLLDSAFIRAGRRKDEVFVTNLVHCHPPKNRASTSVEIANCARYLNRELAVIQPHAIAALGRDAQAWLTGWVSGQPREWVISDGSARSEWGAGEHRLLLLPHPSWAMKQPPAARDDVIDQLASVIRWSFDVAQRSGAPG